jgi:hypothetical protein
MVQYTQLCEAKQMFTDTMCGAGGWVGFYPSEAEAAVASVEYSGG